MDEIGKSDDVVKKIAFHYIKSTDFRLVHVDGPFGGVTPG
jgi:hypothetical protein